MAGLLARRYSCCLQRNHLPVSLMLHPYLSISEVGAIWVPADRPCRRSQPDENRRVSNDINLLVVYVNSCPLYIAGLDVVDLLRLVHQLAVAVNCGEFIGEMLLQPANVGFAERLIQLNCQRRDLLLVIPAAALAGLFCSRHAVA